jgi:pSer/pThr/pTyr-binding forkhead associated (FHA) protein
VVHAAKEGGAPAIPGKLIVVHGDDEGLVFAIGDEDAVIGRGTGCEIQIRGPGISRAHARVTRRDGKVVLHDLGSANGTFVNDRRITQCILETGDQVRIAREVVLSFQYDRPDERETLDLASKKAPKASKAVDGSLTATMINIGRLHLSSGDFSRALRPLGQAEEKLRSMKDVSLDELAAVLADLAECHLGLGKSERARDLAREAFDLSRRGSADSRIAAQANFVLARTMVDLDVVRARELALEARRGLEDREPLARRIDDWLD